MPLSYSMKGGAADSGLSVRRLYELISLGLLKSTKVGRRRLIDAESLRELVTKGVPGEPKPPKKTKK